MWVPFLNLVQVPTSVVYVFSMDLLEYSVLRWYTMGTWYGLTFSLLYIHHISVLDLDPTIIYTHKKSAHDRAPYRKQLYHTLGKMSTRRSYCTSDVHLLHGALRTLGVNSLWGTVLPVFIVISLIKIHFGDLRFLDPLRSDESSTGWPCTVSEGVIIMSTPDKNPTV